MQSSVRLLHMLLALWRIRRSTPLSPFSGGSIPASLFAPLVIAAKVNASDAVASRALKTSGLTRSLDLLRAECNRRWMSVSTGPFTVDVEASGESFLTWLRLGEGDIVVIVVVAVAGRSPSILDMAALDVEGIFPLSSSFLILAFRSSSCSSITDGALVDRVDSVPSARDILRACR